jgi:hypothetical protein
VRTPPMWSAPVGLGAIRTRVGAFSELIVCLW